MELDLEKRKQLEMDFAYMAGFFDGGFTRRDPRKGERLEMWTWTAGGHAAKTALECLLPLLKQKNKQAELALKVLDIKLSVEPERAKEKWDLAREIGNLNSGYRTKATRLEYEYQKRFETDKGGG